MSNIQKKNDTEKLVYRAFLKMAPLLVKYFRMRDDCLHCHKGIEQDTTGKRVTGSPDAHLQADQFLAFVKNELARLQREDPNFLKTP